MLADVTLVRQEQHFYPVNKRTFLFSIQQGYLFSHMPKQKHELCAILSASG